MRQKYRICVAANAMTSSYSQEVDDLFDAVTTIKKLQDRGVPSITVTINDLEYEKQLSEIWGNLGATSK